MSVDTNWLDELCRICFQQRCEHTQEQKDEHKALCDEYRRAHKQTKDGWQ
jgi:hypothetical protein